MGAAAGVAAVSSVPVLILSDVRAQEFIGDVPAVIIGVIGYLIACVPDGHACTVTPAVRLLRHHRPVALGVVVALVKSALAAHRLD